MLHVRHKWVRPKKKLPVGDIAISKEYEEARGKWPVRRIAKVYHSKGGLVGKVRLLMANGKLDEHGKRQGPPSHQDRPVHKLVLLLTADEVKVDDVTHQETE